MRKRGWGRIINVTTSFDTMLAAGFSAYGASKAALEALSASWAKELDGIGRDRQHPGAGRPDRYARLLPARPAAPAGAARSADHGRAGDLARVGAIRRHQRLPLHRARLGREPAAGRGGAARARADGLARPGAEPRPPRAARRCSPDERSDIRDRSASSETAPRYDLPRAASQREARRTGSARRRGST